MFLTFDQVTLSNNAIQSKLKIFMGRNSDELTIDQAVNEINDIIIQAAKFANISEKTVRFSKKKHSRKTHNWFNNDCSNMRLELKKIARKLHRNPHDTHTLHYYHTIRRKYKQLINKSKKNFKDNILNQMDHLNENNPQAFWDLYNKLVDLDKRTRINPISPDEWVNHFTNILSSTANKHQPELEYDMDQYINNNIDSVFNELNFHIKTSEIIKSISNLKLGKSCGLDQISNEMLKAGSTALSPALHKLFNLIFSQSCFPTSWRHNTLTPIHKSGDANNPQNYRGIALTSSLCKLFCAVLHVRLSKFADQNSLIPPNQIGYQKHSRTADHVLTLKTLVDKYINKLGKTKLFTCFVDFKKAFDTISRKALLFKLLKAGIGGNFIRTLQSMYDKVFFRVKLTNGLTDSFISTSGVKQGCVLSPILFNLFVRDLPDSFDSSCDPVDLYDSKLSCLMFADDLVLISQSANGLQNCLNSL